MWGMVGESLRDSSGKMENVFLPPTLLLLFSKI